MIDKTFQIMYIIVEKTTDQASFYREKQQLSGIIGKSTSTIRRKERLNKWETEKYIIYNACFAQIKSGSGGKR
jgi:hypothetical protein